MKVDDPIEDQELAAKIAVGDRKAENRLYTRYRDRIIYYARKHGLYLESAEEVYQDTMLAVIQIIRQPEKQNQPIKLSSLIYTICRNKAIDLIRKSKHQVMENRSEGAEQLVSSDKNSLDDILNEDEHEKMRAAIHGLTTLERRILYLAYVRKWRSEEIGHLLNQTPDNIRQKKLRTLKSLRKKLVKMNISLKNFVTILLLFRLMK